MTKHTNRFMTTASAALLTFGAIEGASAQVALPSEFEGPNESLDRIASYFGGVGFFNVSPVDQTIYSGGSLEVEIGFQPDPFFDIAGAQLGSLRVAGPQLDVPSDADTFSLTVQGPPEGTLSMRIRIKEDDNGDGTTEGGGPDDEFISPLVFIDPGVQVFNFAFSDFIDVNNGDGNDAPDFTTTGVIEFAISFESRASFEGGILEAPVTLHMDHVGFYAGAQMIPSGGDPADLDGDGAVGSADLAILLGAWGPCPAQGACAADLNGDGAVDSADLAILLGTWG